MRRASKWCWFVEPRRWRKNVHTLLQGCFLFLETPKSIYHPSTTPVPQAPKNPSSGFWTHFEFLLLSFFWGGGGGVGLRTFLSTEQINRPGSGCVRGMDGWMDACVRRRFRRGREFSDIRKHSARRLSHLPPSHLPSLISHLPSLISHLPSPIISSPISSPISHLSSPIPASPPHHHPTTTDQTSPPQTPLISR